MARKQNLEATIESNRPLTSAGRLDQRLAGLALALRGVVTETQKMFIYPACQLDNDALDELAVALVEFAEDIHAGIGLWQALENYQSEFFGTPLPLFLEVGEPLSGRFDPRRVRHFLYILWRQLKPDHLLAPGHRDLTKLAETVSEFLTVAFRGQPKDYGVARFLRTPNRRGWDVKRKLVWAGQHSYLFRQQCARYLDEQGTLPTDFDEVAGPLLAQEVGMLAGPNELPFHIPPAPVGRAQKPGDAGVFGLPAKRNSQKLTHRLSQFRKVAVAWGEKMIRL